MKVKATLSDHLVSLKELNNKIQSLKFSDSVPESELENELQSCSDYNHKIRECLIALDLISQEPQPLSSIPVHTLLKRPVAPLAVFESEDGEDLSRFFLQFEETIATYNYRDYDKLLLLKQQVSGRAKTLLKFLEIGKQDYNHAKELL